MYDEDIRIFGHCENCGAAVTDEYEDHCMNNEGQVFCDIECVCEYYEIIKVEV